MISISLEWIELRRGWIRPNEGNNSLCFFSGYSTLYYIYSIFLSFRAAYSHLGDLQLPQAKQPSKGTEKVAVPDAWLHKKPQFFHKNELSGPGCL
jgi:hypothetical protein